jgi:hypothetical protein
MVPGTRDLGHGQPTVPTNSLITEESMGVSSGLFELEPSAGLSHTWHFQGVKTCPSLLDEEVRKMKRDCLPDH